MPQLDLPDEPTNEIKLADWLEVYALISADENSSRGDLEQALRTSSVLESKGSDAIEAKCLEVFFELDQRAISAGDAYPFEIDGATLSVKPRRENYISYIFCLCLSYFRWKAKKGEKIHINPWLLFEELSCIAAAQFVQGKVYRFGTAGEVGNKAKRSFGEKINELCRALGEGEGFRKQPTLKRQDDNVDLVAWRDFKDQLPSKLILFGQCAGGNNSKRKFGELQPEAFWNQWTLQGQVSPFLRSFYVPHRIPRGMWDHDARKSGILFDRCRIAFWAFRNNDAVLADPRFEEWYRSVLSSPTSQKKAERIRKNRSSQAKAAKKRRRKVVSKKSSFRP